MKHSNSMKLVIVFLITYSTINCFCQNVSQIKSDSVDFVNSKSIPESKTTFYIEFGGSSIFYSFDIDRIILSKDFYKLAIALGIEFIPTPHSYIIYIPQVNYLWGKKNHYLELGIGAGLPTYGSKYYGSTRIGYRYQKRGGGFYFHGGISPIFNFSEIGIFPGLALGYTFKKK